jgi:hypothetical protein
MRRVQALHAKCAFYGWGGGHHFIPEAVGGPYCRLPDPVPLPDGLPQWRFSTPGHPPWPGVVVLAPHSKKPSNPSDSTGKATRSAARRMSARMKGITPL